jgi:extradiol dioxygenase family protein
MPEFDHSKCKNPIRGLKVFGRYFALQKATTWWNFREQDGTKRISYLLFSTIEFKGQLATQIVFFKYMLTFSKVSQ